MSSIKKLASQTFWYGFSNIFGRFLNYLLTPLLTTIFASQKYGDISILFASAAFLQVIYTYGMETSYFRFSNLYPEKEVYNTGLSTLVLTSVLFTAILFIPVQSLANYMEIGSHPEYIKWVLLIVALDTLAVMPFSKLRHEGRPRKFAFLKILNILINVSLVVFFLVFCKGQHEKGAENFWAVLYDPSIDIGYVFISQLVASAFTLLLLWKEIMSFSFSWNGKLIKEMLVYSAPLVIVGFGGMINETIDRFMITSMYPGTSDAARSANGIYSANTKLAIIITLFISAFRMGAEPFFFKQSTDEGAQRTYARVMKFFVLTCCICFLSVMLFLDGWKYFMGVKKHPEYLEGLKVVPLLMLGKIFLGVYYNLSIWYKLTNKNLMAAYVTIIGAVITIGFNWLLIPRMGYMGCAIASFLCYGFMMVISYTLGQKYYPVPYAWKKLTAYVVICILLFLVHQLFRNFSPNVWLTHAFGVVLSLAFLVFVVRVENKEFVKIKAAFSK
ncbi:MAG TPA: polysaccharide biosynthesis C-terminal domain-containing protein [Chitinophagaceae bacterium]|nr:polysaccharide biosynthesis C-terminal domain-containing protein [Chitinophagaceae bacterium]